MLDSVLGRTSLKEEIADLEAEIEQLNRQLEAESERRAAAVTDRQQSQEKQNRLEDRIAQLEGELERVSDDTTQALKPRHRESVTGERLEEVLSRLESFRTGPEGALTATVTDNRTIPMAVSETLGERATLVSAPAVVCTDDSSLLSVALTPPVCPSLEPQWGDRFHLKREWFQPTGRHAVGLVRTDLFSLGVYEGSERVAYRGFKSDVKGSHSKGGFSQARFERIRDGQIDDHVDRCLEALAEYEGDRLILVGQRGVVETVADAVESAVEATAAVDATGDPRPALEDAVSSFWTTEIRVI